MRRVWRIAASLLLLLGMLADGLLGEGETEGSGLAATAVRWQSPPSAEGLAALKRALTGVRVVLLGEATRGDGATFEAKIEWIELLERELGFDVLAFEAGFFECELARRRIARGGDARTEIAGALWPLYSQAEEMQPLLDRLASRERPIELIGIDDQVGDEAGGAILPELEALLARLGLPFPEKAVLAEQLPALYEERYATGELPVPGRRERKELERALDALRARLSSSDDPEARFAVQLLRSLASWADDSFRLGRFVPGEGVDPAIQNLRYRQMAENLLWSIRERYPDRKVVVWGLTVVLARDLDRLTTGEPDTRERFDRLEVLGDHLHRELGDAVYAIGFTAGGGFKGSVFANPYPLLEPSPGSFEERTSRTGLERAFFDLRGHPKEWRRALVARPISYKELLGIWPRHLDGIFFLRTQLPAHRKPPSSSQ